MVVNPKDNQRSVSIGSTNASVAASTQMIQSTAITTATSAASVCILSLLIAAHDSTNAARAD